MKRNMIGTIFYDDKLLKKWKKILKYRKWKCFIKIFGSQSFAFGGLLSNDWLGYYWKQGSAHFLLFPIIITIVLILSLNDRWRKSLQFKVIISKILTS